ncbi:Hsp20/alpha crystallin family protein [Mycoplasmatota bacterium]|nr:Hsp20/alpha crystallin family protein [Mycoplasmatota bacterium]
MILLTPNNKNLFKTNKSYFDMVDGFFNTTFLTTQNLFKIDVKENDYAFLFDVELPGIKKEEIKLEYNDERLMISIEKGEKVEDEKENYIHRERRMSSMKRSFYLKDIDSEKIEAKLQDGILKILAPKKENLMNKRQIEIK